MSTNSIAVNEASEDTGFELLYSTTVNQKIPIKKYKSTKTALKIVIAEVDGPVVNGYFCLATEAHDDDGLPHTLEHLVFMGSDCYPYKGMLDVLANRCLASGTNAWTDTDHTCYTMTTAGSEGFLALLPIYVDHILNPLLTDASFLTEVHHINGDGEDGGVVYSEMQGCENTGESLVHRAMIQAIYPGHCGYKSETGGLLQNLRESTTNEKVRDYHRNFYRAENLVLIITGKIEASDVFHVLKPVEEGIIQSKKGGSIPFTRPWQNPVPPFQASIDQLIPYPCEDEEKGMVWLAWRGPSAVYQLYDICALMILMEYLTDTAASPLQKAFVEIPEPYASKVEYSFIENAESIIYLKFDNVPIKKLGEIQRRLFDYMEPLGESGGRNRFDMKRIQLVIQRRILEQLSHLENSPHDTVAFMVIGDALYGNSHEDFRRRLNQIQDFEAISKESECFWSDLVRRYLLGKPCVTTQGIPSRAEMEAMAAAEQQRIEKQRQQLGPDGMANKARDLAQALEQHDQLPSVDLITSVPIPNINSVTYHPINRFCNRDHTSNCSSPKNFDLNQISLRFQLDHVKTNFVHLFALMDTSQVDEGHRMYLALLMNCLLESAMMRPSDSGELQLIPFEQVVAQLAADTIKTTATLGMDCSGADNFFCGAHCQIAVVMLQLQKDKYARGVDWLHDILRRTVFSADRVAVIANKMASDVSRIKRKGNKMALALIRDLVFGPQSNHRACSLIRQQHFLQKLITDLNDPSGTASAKVVETLTTLRDRITRSDSLTIHMAADIDSLTDPLPPWKKWPSIHENLGTKSDGLAHLMADHQLVQPIDDRSPLGAALSLGSIESTFLIKTVDSIHDPHHPDLAAILVALQYLGQLEGPFWRQLRAQGLVYGYHLNLSVNQGLMYLSLYRASHPVSAYKEVRAIMEAHGRDNGESEDGIWQENLLESAKSSLIFELVEKEKAVGDVIMQSVCSYLKNVPIDYNKQLIQSVAKVSMSEMIRAYGKHVMLLLDAARCRCSVICHPSKLDEIVTGIAALGQPLKAYTSVEDSPLNQSI